MNTNAVIFVLMIVAFSFVVLSLQTPTAPESVVSTSHASAYYNTWVCEGLNKYNPETDSYEGWQDINCSHNMLTNAGIGALGNVLNGSTLTLNLTRIALANGTTGTTVIQPTDTVMSGEYLPTGAITDGCALLNKSATRVGQAQGAWNLTYTWTSTCANAVVNVTAIYNNTNGPLGSYTWGNLLFAEANFTSTTLQSNDQINVTWGIYISGTQ